MHLVNMNVLTEPDAAYDATTIVFCPVVDVLVDLWPSTIVVVKGCEVPCHTRILRIEQLTPTLVGLLIELLLRLHQLFVLIELRLLHLQGIVTLQRVGTNPCLDRRTTPAVDDDALGDSRLLLHTLSQEGANG